MWHRTKGMSTFWIFMKKLVRSHRDDTTGFTWETCNTLILNFFQSSFCYSTHFLTAHFHVRKCCVPPNGMVITHPLCLTFERNSFFDITVGLTSPSNFEKLGIKCKSFMKKSNIQIYNFKCVDFDSGSGFLLKMADCRLFCNWKLPFFTSLP